MVGPPALVYLAFERRGAASASLAPNLKIPPGQQSGPAGLVQLMAALFDLHYTVGTQSTLSKSSSNASSWVATGARASVKPMLSEETNSSSAARQVSRLGVLLWQSVPGLVPAASGLAVYCCTRSYLGSVKRHLGPYPANPGETVPRDPLWALAGSVTSLPFCVMGHLRRP